VKENKPQILYSEPVREIMGKPPRKIIVFGTSLIFVIFVLFFIFAWIIRYPDTIPSPVEITTENPPVTLVSKISGRIQHLYVKNKDYVAAGQLLAVMETSASIQDILLLDKILDTLKTPVTLPEFTRLGELQEYYSLYRKNSADLKSFDMNDMYGAKIQSVNKEIRELEEYLRKLLIKEKYYSQNVRIEQKKFRRDSLLFAGNVIPESQLEISHQELIKNNIELQQVRLEYSSKKIEISEKEQLREDYKINRLTEREKLSAQLDESLLNLKAGTAIWKTNYLLISPVDGIAAFTNYWSENQSILKDEPVISIVPQNTGDFIGRINLRMQRSGKVKTGQLVNIKLSGFPYLEYGMLRGIVKSKSLVPAGDSYVIEIGLPQGLTTLYGRKLEFTQNMQGTAEIITEDLRLIQKITDPFRYLVLKNKDTRN
jgi:HlyD family secretion protein